MSTIRQQSEGMDDASHRTLMDVIGLLEIAINEAFDADFANDPIDNCNVTNRQLRLVALIRQAQAGANFCLERMEVGHV